MIKHTSYRSSAFLQALFARNKDFFTLRDAMELLPGKGAATVRKLLSDMARRGLVMRIRDGLYHPIPFEQSPETYFPNWHLTAAAMAGPKEHYIGFYSALDIHGLITQPALTEQVVTHERIKPRVQMVRNVRFEFITLGRERFFGFGKQWIDDFHKVHCSDLEKTFLDCLFMPSYGGGITEITKALYKGRDRLQPARMRNYLERYDTQAVYKRLGFILAGLGILPDLQEFISGKITPSYTPLDPSLVKLGTYHSEWGIIDNIGFCSVAGSLQT